MVNFQEISQELCKHRCRIATCSFTKERRLIFPGILKKGLGQQFCSSNSNSCFHKGTFSEHLQLKHCCKIEGTQHCVILVSTRQNSFESLGINCKEIRLINHGRGQHEDLVVYYINRNENKF